MCRSAVEERATQPQQAALSGKEKAQAIIAAVLAALSGEVLICGVKDVTLMQMSLLQM